MAKIKKKSSQILISQEHNTQAQQILDRYHEIAENLHASTKQGQVEAALKPDFIHERESQESRLCLPGLVSARRSATGKEFEVGWSIELEATPRTYTLPEVPQPIAIYEETQRHWFWTSYTLVHEENEWRIQSMTDEAAIALTLPIEELQKRIEKHDKFLNDYFAKHPPKVTDSKENSATNFSIKEMMNVLSVSRSLLRGHYASHCD